MIASFERKHLWIKLALAFALATIVFICDLKVKLEQNCTPIEVSPCVDSLNSLTIQLTTIIFMRQPIDITAHFYVRLLMTTNQTTSTAYPDCLE